jgi:hypothetical protein
VGLIGRRDRRRGVPGRHPTVVSVEIDRLVLNGLGTVDGHVVGRAVETELRARLATFGNAAPPAGVALDAVRTRLDLGSGAQHSSMVGTGIAGAVDAAVRRAAEGLR